MKIFIHKLYIKDFIVISDITIKSLFTTKLQLMFKIIHK